MYTKLIQSVVSRSRFQTPANKSTIVISVFFKYCSFFRCLQHALQEHCVTHLHHTLLFRQKSASVSLEPPIIDQRPSKPIFPFSVLCWCNLLCLSASKPDEGRTWWWEEVAASCAISAPVCLCFLPLYLLFIMQ